MKALAAPGALLLAVLALGACSDDEPPAGSGGSDPAPSSAAPPAPGGDEPALDRTEVCALVREGIDAFNVGDLEGTIAKFEEAVPLAEDLADDQPSEGTETLLDAVRYYAELPAEDYVEDSVSSPEFLRFKDFTLTECAYAGPPAGATDPAIPA